MYLIWGKVIRGKRRGKDLVFPTLNLRLHKKIPQGVYVSKTKLRGKWYRSVSFVGSARTFGEKDVHAESHIFDWSRDIYGKWVSVRLLKKIREISKFSDKSHLIERMLIDKKEALEYFRK